MLIFIPVVLAILTRNNDECQFQNSMLEAVNQRFDCTYTTLESGYCLIAYHQFYTDVRIANYTLCWKIWFAFA